jgi:hypothetical protein
MVEKTAYEGASSSISEAISWSGTETLDAAFIQMERFLNIDYSTA